MKIKLNGWQRIWIVIALFCAYFTFTGVYNGLPKESKIYVSWSKDMIELLITTPKFNNMDDIQVLKQVKKEFGTSSLKGFVDIVQREYGTPDGQMYIDFEQINSLHQKQVDALFGDQLFFWSAGLAAWLLICFGIYVSGWTVGWVIRGFKKQEK
jgi:hypothetical protein